MDARTVEDIYPLSPMQQGMLFHSLYAGESGVYFEQSSWTLRGVLDRAAFEHAWQQVIDRHSALRTSFVWEELDEPLQVVHRQAVVPFTFEDLRGLAPEEQAVRLDAFMAADRAHRFDLLAAPLMRLALLQLDDQTHHFVWSHHHLLLDGWSQPILFGEVFALYEAATKGRAARLPAPHPYRDYIAWLQGQDKVHAEAYWRRTLVGFAAPIELMPSPARAVTPENADAASKRDRVDYLIHSDTLDAESTGKLHILARQHRLTLNTIVQGAWALILSRYSRETDIVFGATVSGRPVDLPGAEGMVGLFINTLPVRVQVKPNVPALAWLRELQVQQAEQRQFEHSHLVEVQGWSDVPRGLPLFQNILVFENYPIDDAISQRGQTEGLRIESNRTFTRTNYPLTVAVSPGKQLGIELAYEVAHYDPETILRLAGHLKTVLAAIAEAPERSLAHIPLLTEAERRQILGDWTATARPFPSDTCIHHLFEQCVEQSPDDLALVFNADPFDDGQEQLTYAELNHRANRLAHLLRKRGVGPEVLVGICMERSTDMIVALLGVLKAGGAYLPLDPDLPPDRLAYILRDAQASLLLTQTSLLARLEAADITSLCLDSHAEGAELLEAESAANPTGVGAGPANLAYVIYTSGSTGRPKGTLLHHRGICNIVRALAQTWGLDHRDRVLQFASFSFDASVCETFLALTSGAALYLTSHETLLSIPALVAFLQRHEITTTTMPPSLLRLLPAHQLPTLNAVGSVGEACTPEIVAQWSHAKRSDARSESVIEANRGAERRLFLNGYGPTETTVGAAWAIVAGLPEGARNVPIGRPIANTRLYILDGHMQPVPVGVPGELYIGGTGVARGYLGRPELTAERFVPDPFVGDQEKGREGERERGRILPPVSLSPYPPISGARLYRAGDLARWLPDGQIEFLGRLDDQVKVRGFRIELGEIEAALNVLPEVHQSAVLAYEDKQGSKTLVAYVAPHRDATVMPADLRAALKRTLPDYMVPSFFVILNELPLLPSGKINRKALPAPEADQLRPDATYVAPRTPVESGLAETWAEVLGVAHVGMHDNFFELGGHSLVATQVVSRARQVFGVELPLRDLFDVPTVAGLAGRVEALLRAGASLEGEAERSLIPIPRGGDLQLSFAQQRLWFLDQLEPGGLFNNIPTAIRLTGNLDIGALGRALNEIVRRHEVLRTTFSTSGGKPVQVIHPADEVALQIEDLSGLAPDEREGILQRRVQAEASTPFDLDAGPLLRARLVKLAEQDHVAVVVMHHIVSDGWSMGVFVREISTLYAVFCRGGVTPPLQQEASRGGAPSPDGSSHASRTAGLPPLPIQYADFAAWQRGWLDGPVLEQQLAYWREQLAGSATMLDLPTDRPRPAIQTSHGGTVSFALGPELSAALRQLSHDEGVTLFMTLLAGFQALLHRYTGQEDINIGSPIAGRNRPEIENLIGFFVNTLVLRARPHGGLPFRELLAQVRETALAAYAHQDLPFELLVEALQPQRDLSHTPLFQVMFVLDPPAPHFAELPGLSLHAVEAHSGAASFDITLSMAAGPQGLGGYIEYNTDLFDASTIERMLGHYRTLLQGVAEDPERLLGELPLLTDAERQQLLVDWNRTELDTPTDRCAHGLFEARVAAQPDAAAVIFEDQTLTYSQLDRLANQLAHHLVGLGVGPETLVGLAVERSLETIIGILGIMKAGGAYLPLDPSYPANRLAFMIQDSGIQVLLTQARLSGQLPLGSDEAQHVVRDMVCLDAGWPEIARQPTTRPTSRTTPDNAAYVIYTSGTTGRPKGAVLNHRGLSNLAEVQRQAFDIRPGSRVLQFAPISFDASVWETFMALANGGTLCLARQEVLASGPDLLRLLRDQRITTVTLPPSVLSVLEPCELPDLAVVIAAGEKCTAEIVRQWTQSPRDVADAGVTSAAGAASRRFCDAYGPTETTVCASMTLCDPSDPRDPTIGRPIGNCQLYVVDAHLRPVPIGVPGELVVGGVNVGRGYLGRPDLTAERFVPDLFAPSLSPSPVATGEGWGGGARLYRTGDLVRYRADGNIEFLGRIDTQVKVRGFRIELGEIETALRQHPEVLDAIVVAWRPDSAQGSDARLVAYIIPKRSEADLPQTDAAPTIADLRTALRQQLPEYMVPSFFVMLTSFPLSPSGKIDRKALPAPEGGRAAIETEYVAPRNDVEAQLSAICADLLRTSQVGIYDNFFDLGGHSLLATQLISRIRESFAVELSLRALFEHPTVAELAVEVDTARARAAAPQMPAITAISREARRIKRSDLGQK